MKDYHEYVWNDDKFSGRFDEMYENCSDPWKQTQVVSNSISRQVACNLIDEFSISSLVEIGCGLGYTLDFISNNTQAKLLGCDISPTAIQKASASFPNLDFVVADVEDLAQWSDYQCIFFSQLTWYILENNKLDRAFDLLKKYYSGKYFLQTLVFYRGQQRYGTEYFTTLDQFVDFCPFSLKAKVEIDLYHTDRIDTCCLWEI